MSSIAALHVLQWGSVPNLLELDRSCMRWRRAMRRPRHRWAQWRCHPHETLPGRGPTGRGYFTTSEAFHGITMCRVWRWSRRGASGSAGSNITGSSSGIDLGAPGHLRCAVLDADKEDHELQRAAAPGKIASRKQMGVAAQGAGEERRQEAALGSGSVGLRLGATAVGFGVRVVEGGDVPATDFFPIPSKRWNTWPWRVFLIVTNFVSRCYSVLSLTHFF